MLNNGINIAKYSLEDLVSIQRRVKLLSKSKTIMVLGEIANHFEGLRFTDIQFNLRVNSSTLNSALKSLNSLNCISRVNDIYTVTKHGKRILALCQDITNSDSLIKSEMRSRRTSTNDIKDGKEEKISDGRR